MISPHNFPQLFVRWAITSVFFSAVADRLGFWDPLGSPNASWNWENFLIYSNKINFFVPEGIGEVLAVSATVFEVLFGVFLLIGVCKQSTGFIHGISGGTLEKDFMGFSEWI